MAQPRLQFAAVLAAIAFSAHSASAAGVNLRWSACAGDGGVSNRTSACALNILVSPNLQFLVASYVSGITVPGVAGLETAIIIDVAGPALPPWFQFHEPGSCRQSALTANVSPSSTAVNCIDPFQSNAVGGIGTYTVGAFGPNTIRFLVVSAVPPAALGSVAAGVEYFACNVNISNVKTTGLGACAGCLTPACIAVGNINVYSSGSSLPALVLTAPANGTDSNYATWQGGGGAGPLPGGACPAATPTRNSTWGAVKSLYR